MIRFFFLVRMPNALINSRFQRVGKISVSAAPAQHFCTMMRQHRMKRTVPVSPLLRMLRPLILLPAAIPDPLLFPSGFRKAVRLPTPQTDQSRRSPPIPIPAVLLHWTALPSSAHALSGKARMPVTLFLQAILLQPVQKHWKIMHLPVSAS